jgi:hypothetical protein
VIVTIPAPIAVTKPPETVATAVLEDCQVAVSVTVRGPSVEKFWVALN